MLQYDAGACLNPTPFTINPNPVHLLTSMVQVLAADTAAELRHSYDSAPSSSASFGYDNLKPDQLYAALQVEAC